MTVPSSDGVELAIHHLVAGEPATRLLISHATGFHGLAYGPLATGLDAELDVWALDHRGHGATAAPPGWDVSWRGYADDAEAAAVWLAAHRRPRSEPLVGFGHSMGGTTLLIAAHRHPGLFSLLVLFEPVVFPSDHVVSEVPTPMQVAARRRRPWFPSYADARENFAGKPPMKAFDPAALDAYVAGGLTPVDPDEPDGPVRLLCVPDLEADTYAAGACNGAWDLLPAIETPTVVLGGTADPTEGPGLLAPLVAERLPNGRYEEHHELNHFGPFTHPNEVAGMIGRAVATVA